MGERASVRMKSASGETKECLYLHWGGDQVGEFLMKAEAAATTNDPDDCLTVFESVAKAAGYNPEREVIAEGISDGSNGGHFLVDVSDPHWKVEIESEYGYGLRGESRYHFHHKVFEVPNDPNGFPENDGRTDDHKYSHLFNAVADKDERMVEALLAAGADPNRQNAYNGRYPLHQAAYSDENVDIARMLIEAGARLDVVDKSNKTPKQVASGQFGSPAILEVIEHHEAYLEAERRKNALGSIASRPDDLASPEDALSRRSRGRFM